MPLLAYCIMEAAAVTKPASGVGGRKLEEVQNSGLSCFFSRFNSRQEITSIPAAESAVAFHKVLQAMLQQGALVPFRFPSIVEDEENLLQHMREHAAMYTASLARLRDMVQMEMRITGSGKSKPASQPASGGEYLRARQARTAGLAAAAERFREATRPWVEEWRQEQMREGMRCYALVQRKAVSDFLQATQAISDSFAGVRVSGPWPATEFMGAFKDS